MVETKPGFIKKLAQKAGRSALKYGPVSGGVATLVVGQVEGSPALIASKNPDNAYIASFIPKTRTAEAAPPTEVAKSPADYMRGFMSEVLVPGTLPPEGENFEVKTQPLGKDHLHHSYPYTSLNGDRIVITLTTTTTGEYRLASAQLYEDNVAQGDVRAKLGEQNVTKVFGEKFAPNPALAEPWKSFNIESVEGKPPATEKVALAPDGTLESRGARINGQGPYQVIYVAARAFQGSVQQENGSVFVPTR